MDTFKVGLKVKKDKALVHNYGFRLKNTQYDINAGQCPIIEICSVS